MQNSRRFGIVIVCFLILTFTTVCFARAGGGQSYGGSGVSSYESGSPGTGIFIIAAIVLVIFFLPAIKAFSAAKGAKKFKALVFVTTFFEWLGWSLCITIIGIPIGLALVLAGQSGRVLVLL